MPMIFQALDLTETKLLVVEVPPEILHDSNEFRQITDGLNEAIKQFCRIRVPLILCAKGVKITALTDEQLEAFGLQRIPT